MNDREKSSIERGGAKAPEGAAVEKPVVDVLKEASLLRERVEARRIEMQKDVETRVTQREGLIVEIKATEESLREAQSVLDYLNTMREAGEIQGEEELSKIKDVENLVASLESKVGELGTKIDLISSAPEVMEKLEESAGMINKEHDAQKIAREFNEQLNQEEKALGEEIIAASEEEQRLYKEYIDASNRVSYDKARDFFYKADDVSRDPEIRSKLGELRESFVVGTHEKMTPEELVRQLSELRSTLGLFKGKEKAAIDLLLLNKDALEQFDQARREYEAKETAYRTAKNEGRARLMGRYTNMEAKTNEANQKIVELVPNQGRRYDLNISIKDIYLRRFLERPKEATDKERSKAGNAIRMFEEVLNEKMKLDAKQRSGG